MRHSYCTDIFATIPRRKKSFFYSKLIVQCNKYILFHVIEYFEITAKPKQNTYNNNGASHKKNNTWNKISEHYYFSRFLQLYQKNNVCINRRLNTHLTIADQYDIVSVSTDFSINQYKIKGVGGIKPKPEIDHTKKTTVHIGKSAW